MKPNKDRVIISPSECACHSVHTLKVHHRDFPEIWTEASSPEEGAAYLIGCLSRAQDAFRTSWHRLALEEAIADVEAFLEALKRAEVEEALERSERETWMAAHAR
jgi:hypothetical protein